MTIITAFSRPGAGDLAAQIEFDPSAVSSRRAPRSSMPRATPRISCSPIKSRTGRPAKWSSRFQSPHKAGETTLFEGEHGLLQVVEHPAGQQIAVHQFRLDVAQFGPGLIDPLPSRLGIARLRPTPITRWQLAPALPLISTRMPASLRP